MPTPGGIRLASSAAGTTMCGMAANGPSPGDSRSPSPAGGAGIGVAGFIGVFLIVVISEGPAAGRWPPPG